MYINSEPRIHSGIMRLEIHLNGLTYIATPIPPHIVVSVVVVQRRRSCRHRFSGQSDPRDVMCVKYQHRRRRRRRPETTYYSIFDYASDIVNTPNYNMPHPRGGNAII